MLKIVRAPKRPHILRRDPRRRKPVRTLPAVTLSPHRAHSAMALVERRLLLRTRRRPFLVGIVNDEDMRVTFLVLRDEVVFVGVFAEAARVNRHHVDRRLAVRHPLRQEMPRTARRRHAEGVSLVEPDISQALRGADERTAVGRVGDRTVHDVFYARLGERRHAPYRGLHMRHEAIQVAGEKVFLKAFGNAVGEDRRRALLVGAEDEAAPLLAHVVGRVALAQHREFGFARRVSFGEGGMFFGDDVLVLHRNGRHINSDEGAGLAGVVAGGEDEVFAGDLAFGSCRLPLVAGAFYFGDGRVLVDFGAVHAGAAGEGGGEVDGGDVSVVGVVEGADEVVRFGEGPERFDIGGGDEFKGHADGVGGAAVFFVFVHALVVAGEAQVAGDVEGDVLSGFGFEGFVEVDGVFVDLADGVTHVEEGEESGGVPG